MTTNHFRNIFSVGVEIPVYSYEYGLAGCENTQHKQENINKTILKPQDHQYNNNDLLKYTPHLLQAEEEKQIYQQELQRNRVVQKELRRKNSKKKKNSNTYQENIQTHYNTNKQGSQRVQFLPSRQNNDDNRELPQLTEQEMKFLQRDQEEIIDLFYETFYEDFQTIKNGSQLQSPEYDEDNKKLPQLTEQENSQQKDQDKIIDLYYDALEKELQIATAIEIENLINDNIYKEQIINRNKCYEDEDYKQENTNYYKQENTINTYLSSNINQNIDYKETELLQQTEQKEDKFQTCLFQEDKDQIQQQEENYINDYDYLIVQQQKIQKLKEKFQSLKVIDTIEDKTKKKKKNKNNTIRKRHYRTRNKYIKRNYKTIESRKQQQYRTRNKYIKRNYKTIESKKQQQLLKKQQQQNKKEQKNRKTKYSKSKKFIRFQRQRYKKRIKYRQSKYFKKFQKYQRFKFQINLNQNLNLTKNSKKFQNQKRAENNKIYKYRQNNLNQILNQTESMMNNNPVLKQENEELKKERIIRKDVNTKQKALLQQIMKYVRPDQSLKDSEFQFDTLLYEMYQKSFLQMNKVYDIFTELKGADGPQIYELEQKFFQRISKEETQDLFGELKEKQETIDRIVNETKTEIDNKCVVNDTTDKDYLKDNFDMEYTGEYKTRISLPDKKVTSTPEKKQRKQLISDIKYNIKIIQDLETKKQTIETNLRAKGYSKEKVREIDQITDKGKSEIYSKYKALDEHEKRQITEWATEAKIAILKYIYYKRISYVMNTQSQTNIANGLKQDMIKENKVSIEKLNSMINEEKIHEILSYKCSILEHMIALQIETNSYHNTIEDIVNEGGNKFPAEYKTLRGKLLGIDQYNMNQNTLQQFNQDFIKNGIKQVVGAINPYLVQLKDTDFQDQSRKFDLQQTKFQQNELKQILLNNDKGNSRYLKIAQRILTSELVDDIFANPYGQPALAYITQENQSGILDTIMKAYHWKKEELTVPGGIENENSMSQIHEERKKTINRILTAPETFTNDDQKIGLNGGLILALLQQALITGRENTYIVSRNAQLDKEVQQLQIESQVNQRIIKNTLTEIKDIKEVLKFKDQKKKIYEKNNEIQKKEDKSKKDQGKAYHFRQALYEITEQNMTTNTISKLHETHKLSQEEKITLLGQMTNYNENQKSSYNRTTLQKMINRNKITSPDGIIKLICPKISNISDQLKNKKEKSIEIMKTTLIFFNTTTNTSPSLTTTTNTNTS